VGPLCQIWDRAGNKNTKSIGTLKQSSLIMVLDTVPYYDIHEIKVLDDEGLIGYVIIEKIPHPWWTMVK
jgi:hypothetical protein